MQLHEHRFFALFDRSTAQGLLSLATLADFKDGEFIFNEGDSPDSIYLVLSGTVSVVRRPVGQPVQVLANVPHNDFFGEYGVLDGLPRSAGAMARGAVTLARLEREALMQVLRQAPGSTMLGLCQHVISNLRSTDDRYIQDVVRMAKMSALGEMMASILHDCRNPFMVIGVAADLLRRRHQDPETLRLCSTIGMQLDRVTQMADEVIEFSRGTYTLNKTPTRVADLLSEFEFLNRDYLTSCGVELRTEAKGEVFEVDARKVTRILQNLVNNALDALPKQGGLIQIIACAEGPRIVIRVTDNGSGIPDSIRDRIFEPFVTQGKEKGLGLGLAIAKSFVEAHGGTIALAPKGTAGTTFTLDFPKGDTGPVTGRSRS